MGIRVGRVVELVEHQPLAPCLHRQGEVARGLHAALHQYQLGTIGLHGIAPLLAHGIWHDEPHPVASRRRYHGQRDAGVAGGGLDEAGPRR